MAHANNDTFLYVATSIGSFAVPTIYVKIIPYISCIFFTYIVETYELYFYCFEKLMKNNMYIKPNIKYNTRVILRYIIGCSRSAHDINK